jgi:hypothetical protein
VKGKRSGTWIWFFVILLALAALSVTILIVYSRGQQLKPEQLQQARDLWQQKGPRAYDMDYTTKTLTGSNSYQVKVRHGRVQSVLCNGEPQPPEKFIYHDMNALFHQIERFLTLAREPGSPRTFITARFDATDGHLTHCVRALGSKERVEISVTLTPVADDGEARANRRSPLFSAG